MNNLRDFINQARDGKADTTSEPRHLHYDKETHAIAERNNAHWTAAEIKILMDPELTTKQSAKKLGRTLSSVVSKRCRVRDATKN